MQIFHFDTGLHVVVEVASRGFFNRLQYLTTSVPVEKYSKARSCVFAVGVPEVVLWVLRALVGGSVLHALFALLPPAVLALPAAARAWGPIAADAVSGLQATRAQLFLFDRSLTGTST